MNLRQLKRKLDKLNKKKDYFVILLAGLEIYDSVSNMEPRQQLGYPLISQVTKLEDSFYFVYNSILFYILINFQTPGNKDFFDYFLFWISKYNGSKNEIVQLDFSSRFDSLDLMSKAPEYIFKYQDFKIEDGLRRQREFQEKQKENEF